MTGGVLATLLLAGAPWAAAQPTRQVELELVLAVDTSTSVDDTEFSLQREGLAAAFVAADVLSAIRAAGDLGIAVALVHWSGVGRQHLVVDWTLIREAADGLGFSRAVAAAPRASIGMTDIGGAIAFALEAIETNAFSGRRRVIDVSGDGSSDAARVAAERDRAVARGATINGLVIENEDIDLGELAKIDVREHYADHVIGGVGAFMMTARDFEDFATVIRRKLIREIAGPATAMSD